MEEKVRKCYRGIRNLSRRTQSEIKELNITVENLEKRKNRAKAAAENKRSRAG